MPTSEWKYPKIQNILGDPHQKILLEDYFIMGYSIPAGFIFDGASIPGVAKWYVDDDDHLLPAALVHDYLYVNQPCTRKEADHIFWEIMIYTGVRRSQAYVCWLAVRIGGWRPWNRRKDQ
tara:strand:+ start:3371 stop:3730 length:360 start_codon:yes stop_codon:yes gene_type:complete